MSSHWLSQEVDAAMQERDLLQLERDNRGFLKDIRLTDIDLDHRMQMAGISCLMKLEMDNASSPEAKKGIYDRYNNGMLESIGEYNEQVKKILGL